MATILAIDNGTQSIRAIIYDLKGNEVAKEQLTFKPYSAPDEDWQEQNPEYFWESLTQVCQKLWQHPNVDKKAIKAMSVTTMRNTVVTVDKAGNPVRPAIIWTDKRRLDNPKPITGWWKYAFKLAGVEKTIQNFQASCQAAWIARHESAVWEKTNKFLLLSGYLNYKLTDKFRDSIASQVGYIPFDYRNHCWARSSDWKWQVAPVSKAMLPTLVKPGGNLGYISADASKVTGLPEGLPVVAAGGDKSSEVLGAGCIDEHQACLSYGTTATVNVTSAKYIEPIRFVPPYPSNIRNAYTLEFQIYRGYWMISWFKEQFGHLEQSVADKEGVPTESIFDEAIKNIPAGSDGLMLQAFWSPGVKIPGPEAKGAIIGFDDRHTRAHIYRAILEGIAYGLKDGLERIEKKTKTKIKQLVVSGGGSQSDVAMQITADIFNMPVKRAHTYETSALGAAINAAVGIGLFDNYDDATKAMCHEGEVFYPDAKSARLYETLYRGIYKKMYGRLRPLYHQFRSAYLNSK